MNELLSNPVIYDKKATPRDRAQGRAGRAWQGEVPWRFCALLQDQQNAKVLALKREQWQYQGFMSANFFIAVALIWFLIATVMSLWTTGLKPPTPLAAVSFGLFWYMMALLFRE